MDKAVVGGTWVGLHGIIGGFQFCNHDFVANVSCGRYMIQSVCPFLV